MAMQLDKGSNVNRVLVYLKSLETRQKAKRDALIQECEAIEALADGIIEFWMPEDDPDAGLEIGWLIRTPKDREPLTTLDGAGALLARELRDYASAINAAADRLEGANR